MGLTYDIADFSDSESPNYKAFAEFVHKRYGENEVPDSVMQAMFLDSYQRAAFKIFDKLVADGIEEPLRDGEPRSAIFARNSMQDKISEKEICGECYETYMKAWNKVKQYYGEMDAIFGEVSLLERGLAGGSTGAERSSMETNLESLLVRLNTIAGECDRVTADYRSMFGDEWVGRQVDALIDRNGFEPLYEETPQHCLALARRAASLNSDDRGQLSLF